MQSQLTAQHAPATTAEENDDRYVAICSIVKVRGEKLREELFQAIEADDFETALERAETIQLIDRCYMLSLQRGMGIHEKKKAALAKAAEAAKAPLPISSTEVPPPERRRIFDRIFRR